MIVRISGEGQYELADEDKQQLNSLETEVVSVVESGQESGFEDAFTALLEFVRGAGAPIGEDELEGSDVILPPRRHLASPRPARTSPARA